MANETESAALMERCSGRMDGWAKYYEYFHKLSSDMQVAAQTRARERPDACARQHRVALLTLMCASRASCGQATTELAAQRRTSHFDPLSLVGLPPLKASGVHKSGSSGSSCFESIATGIKLHDKPYVQIEDGEDGSAVRILSRHARAQQQLPGLCAPTAVARLAPRHERAAAAC